MTSKKARPSLTSQGDEAFIHDVLQQRRDIAETLRQSASRVSANSALADIFQANEATQLGLLKALAKQQDTDAADLLLALHELAPQKDVRKEARRALIQLAGSKIYPSWAPGSEQPTAIASNYPPRFWKGLVTLQRESGQAQLTLCWEYGFEYSEARSLNFLLDFWRDGIKDFVNETGTKRTIEKHLQEQVNLYLKGEDGPIQTTDCTLAEGRRLVLEALDVNDWRKTTPHKDFRHFMPTINQLILNAPAIDTDRGSTFINPNMEPDEAVGNYLGAWSLGDYGLCYDLFTRDSSLREGLERDEWIERRRDWANEAHPQHYEPRVIREREQAQSAIWLPGTFAQARAASRREIDACWSLEMGDTPLSGTLPEMPFATAVQRETERRWFWTSYTLVSEDGAWRIQRITDEGANAQGLPLGDLEKRLNEHRERLRQIAATDLAPREPPPQKELEEIIWRTLYALTYLDALLVKNPLDARLYADAVGACLSLGLSERCIVYLRKWEEHFPQDPQHINILQQLGSTESLLASDYQSLGLKQRANRFFALAEQDLQRAASADPSPTNYMLLGEAKMAQEDADAAIAYLQQGLAANPTRHEEAQIENDLAGVNVLLEKPEEALRHFHRVEALDPTIKNLWINIGQAYRQLKDILQAERYLTRAVEEDPQNANTFILLAALYAENRELRKSRKVVEQGLPLHPNSAHLHALLAGVLLDDGEARRAEAELRVAERLDPDYPLVKAMRDMFNDVLRR